MDSKKWLWRIVRIVGTVGLFWLAFRRVDTAELVKQLLKVPWWFVVASAVWGLMVVFVGSWRWSMLLLDKPKIVDVWRFFRASMSGAFYTLLLPTAVAGDLLKWTWLIKSYPQLTKVKLVGSTMVDRMVGLTMFVIGALVAVLVGGVVGVEVPKYAPWLFLAILAGLLLVYFGSQWQWVEKLVLKLPKGKRLMEVVGLMRQEDQWRLVKCVLISGITESMWVVQLWVTSMIFGANFSIVAVVVIIPIISVILMLPISLGGFGARESLYLYFFGQLGYPAEGILLTSTFSGIMAVLLALLGGLGMVM